MYLDFSKRQRRYMPVKLKNGMKLDIEEPDMRILQNLQSIEDNRSIRDITAAIKTIISRNKQKRKFSPDEIAVMFTADEMVEFLKAYADFTAGIQNDPN